MGLKDNSMHAKSCVRNAVELAKVLEEQSKDKILLCMNADGGGDINPKFERVQAVMLHLVMKLNLEKLTWVKTAAGVSAWNPAEISMTSMSKTFTNVSIFRFETSTNIEQ